MPIKNHIQFLRAISVISVFFYHCNTALFKNGYLGVDIFFLISGYVITSKFYFDYKKKDYIDLIDFYKKRFKRIFPLLFFFLFTIYIAIVFFVPSQFSLGVYLYETISALFGLSNLYFLYRGAEYFDSEIYSPLIHTWSLGIEEQFYIIYPIIFFVLLKIFKFDKLKYLLIILACLSFLFPLIFKASNNYLFYFPFFRFWELLAGSILFLFTLGNTKKNNKLFLVSFLLIVFILLIDYQNHSQLLNLIILILICSFIYFYEGKTFLSKYVENKFFVNIGNISYSFYLWHLPIIYFLNFYFSLNKLLLVAISFVFTLLVSQLSYKYIEQKFRYKKYYLKNSFFLILPFATLSIFLFITSEFKLYWGNHGNPRPLMINKLNFLNTKFNVHERFFYFDLNINENLIYKYCKSNINRSKKLVNELKPECLKNNSTNNLYYAEGISQMAQYIHLLEKSKIENYYYKHRTNEVYSFEEINNLKKYYNKIFYIRSINSERELEVFKENIKNFDQEINFFIFGPMPFSNKKNTLTCLVKNSECIFPTSEDIKNRKINKIYNELSNLKKEFKQRISFINVYQEICPDGTCKVYDAKKNVLIFRDKTHFNREGSLYLLKALNLKIQN